MESSSYQILKQKKFSKRLKTLVKGAIPISVEWGDGGKQPRIKLSDGSETLGSCIHCINPPCMEYANDELSLETFKEFPSDRNLEVCPTRAISWSQDSDSPTIDDEACILCGICVSRCPVSAIYLNPETETAVINDKPSAHFILENQETSEAIQKPLIQMFSGVPKNGVFISENDTILQKFFDKFQSVSSKQSAQFPNHLARNLMIEIGIKALMRRRGDTNIRMDIVFGQVGKKSGTCEVELELGILDAPRNLLDNVAVLVSRYNLSRDDILPLVVTFSLPNQRSEYWQVIKDIRDVLNVKINSVTIGMLAMMVWNRIRISLDSHEILYVDSDSYSLRKKIESILRRKLNASIGYPGFIESQK